MYITSDEKELGPQQKNDTEWVWSPRSQHITRTVLCILLYFAQHYIFLYRNIVSCKTYVRAVGLVRAT